MTELGISRLMSVLKSGALRQLDITLDLSKDNEGDYPMTVYTEVLADPRLDWIPLTDFGENDLKVTYRVFGHHESIEAFHERFELPAEFGHTEVFDQSPLAAFYQIQLVISSDFERQFLRTIQLRGLLAKHSPPNDPYTGHPVYLVTGPWILLMNYYFNEYMAVKTDEDLLDAIEQWTSMIPCPVSGGKA